MPVQPGQLFRKLPQIGELLDRPEVAALERTYSRKLVVEYVRSALDELRRDLSAGRHTEFSLEQEIRELGSKIEQHLRTAMRTSLRPVINATGVILQTNLGRAPLSQEAVRQIGDIARGYCNLELDLQSGERGRRDMHVQQLILNVLALRSSSNKKDFEGKAAMVVNNCAAACFLALNTLAEGGEVIVSRGELVEIGGGFRVPDILRKSGAVLREVGTTNRTRLSDYEAAIAPATRLILRVHRSNFRMEGFTERPSLEELRDLGERVSLPVFVDQGTGAVVELGGLGIESESSLTRSVASGVALVACSGDKLLGGPQCGILVGAERYIERIRANPLFRAMRVEQAHLCCVGSHTVGVSQRQGGNSAGHSHDARICRRNQRALSCHGRSAALQRTLCGCCGDWQRIGRGHNTGSFAAKLCRQPTPSSGIGICVRCASAQSQPSRNDPFPRRARSAGPADGSARRRRRAHESS